MTDRTGRPPGTPAAAAFPDSAGQRPVPVLAPAAGSFNATVAAVMTRWRMR